MVLSFLRPLAAAVVVASISPIATAQSCTPDINGDGIVDASDLSILLAAWGSTYPATIDSVSPSSGPEGGGTVITLTGSGLAATSAVRVGGSLCTNLEVVSAGEVRATTPAGALGPTSVAVTTPAGTTVLKNGFTYAERPGWATVLQAEVDAGVVTDSALREAIAASGLPWRVRDNATQIEMLLVPAGSFTMGCSSSTQVTCFSDENPVHTVTITNAFYIGRYEVTQAQWAARMGSNPSFFVGANGFPGLDTRPVDSVSWNMIQTFLSSTGLRLPSEAEWEYAYRAGTTTAFHSMLFFPNGTDDDKQLGDIAWFAANSSGQTQPVGQKTSNALGLHDMSGNSWEWVNDWYGANYYAASPASDPTGPVNGLFRVQRGGAYSSGSDVARASARGGYPPDITDPIFGFRVARNP